MKSYVWAVFRAWIHEIAKWREDNFVKNRYTALWVSYEPEYNLNKLQSLPVFPFVEEGKGSHHICLPMGVSETPRKSEFVNIVLSRLRTFRKRTLLQSPST